MAAERRAQGPHGRSLRQEVLYRKFVRHYRRVLPIILEHLSFRSDERYRPVMEALASIQRTLHSRARHFAEPVPIKRVVPRNWQDRVIEDVKGTKKVHRRYDELCALHQLQCGLKCKEVWVDGALAYRNPSEDLPHDWDQTARRMVHYQKLGQPAELQIFFEELRQRLTQALEHFNRQLPTLPHVWIRDPKPDRLETGVLILDKLPRQTS